MNVLAVAGEADAEEPFERAAVVDGEVGAQLGVEGVEDGVGRSGRAEVVDVGGEDDERAVGVGASVVEADVVGGLREPEGAEDFVEVAVPAPGGYLEAVDGLVYFPDV